MRRRTGIAATVGGVALATVGALVVSPVAGTAATGNASAEKVQPRFLNSAEVSAMDKRIAKELKRSKGGVRTSVNQIEWKNEGVVLTVPLPGEKRARAVNEPVSKGGECRLGQVCLFDGIRYSGKRYSFTTCATRTLSKYGMKNKVTSFKNNQKGGATSWLFYINKSGGRSILIDTDARSRVSYIGKLSSNKADYIKVCG